MTDEVVLRDATERVLEVGDFLLAGNGRAFKYLGRYSTSFLARGQEIVPRRGKWDFEPNETQIDSFICVYISPEEFDALLKRNKALTVDEIKGAYMQRYRDGEGRSQTRAVLLERKQRIQEMRDRQVREIAAFEAEKGGAP